MRSKLFLASACAVAALAASSAAASLSDFRLPAERSQPQPAPDVQGPVAPDVPASRRGPAAPTPTPSLRAEPSPEPASPPVEVPTGLLAPQGEAPVRRDTVPAPAPEPGLSVAAAAPPAVPMPAAGPATAPTRSPQSAAEPSSEEASQDTWWWLWLFGAALMLLGVGGWAARRMVRRPSVRADTPQIERPRPAGAAPSPPQGGPLQVSLEPLRLALTLMNATLAYRLEIANRGAAPLSGLTIGADMISAHASLSREEQLSGPRDTSCAPGHRIDRLEPGESRLIEGEFRLPFAQIVPIRQGNATLLVPLARLRVDAEGAEPLVRTFAIGQPGDGDALQPFRLDHGPRIYPRLAQHAFA